METIDSEPVVQGKRGKWRRVTMYVVVAGVIYLFSAGPVTRYAPEFADWFYAPLSPVADVPLAGSVLRGWLSLWGVDVS